MVNKVIELVSDSGVDDHSEGACQISFVHSFDALLGHLFKTIVVGGDLGRMVKSVCAKHFVLAKSL